MDLAGIGGLSGYTEEISGGWDWSFHASHIVEQIQHLANSSWAQIFRARAWKADPDKNSVCDGRLQAANPIGKYERRGKT